MAGRLTAAMARTLDPLPPAEADARFAALTAHGSRLEFDTETGWAKLYIVGESDPFVKIHAYDLIGGLRPTKKTPSRC